MNFVHFTGLILGMLIFADPDFFLENHQPIAVLLYLPTSPTRNVVHHRRKQNPPILTSLKRWGGGGETVAKNIDIIVRRRRFF